MFGRITPLSKLTALLAGKDSSQGSVAAPTTGASRFVQANRLRLHYLEWGDADAFPMILLHGLRSTASVWEEVAQVMGDRFRVLALDQRGRGESTWPRDKNYSLNAHVFDLRQFMAALNIRRAILVGHSMGGQNVITFSARYPERVDALILVDIGPEIDPRGLERIGREVADPPQAFSSWEEAQAFLRRLYPHVSSQALERRVRSTLTKRRNGQVVWQQDPAILEAWQHGQPTAQDDLWYYIRKVSSPTLLVRGEHSDILTRETAERTVGAIYHSRLVEVPGAGHGVFEDNPEAFLRGMHQFLEEFPVG